MDIVVDTDVASRIHRDRLSEPLAAQLRARRVCVSFVTIGELTQWTDLHNWGLRSRTKLDSWLAQVAELGYDHSVARTWGRLSAAARRRGRTPPVNDTWIAACCLASGLPLLTLNRKDFIDFAEYHSFILL